MREHPVTRPIAAAVLVAAAILIAAEFTTLFTVHVVGRPGPGRTVTGGAHHAYALIPIALLAAVLAVAVRRGPGRPALIAVGALAVIALVIVLLRDVPDAHKTGLIAAGAGPELGTARPAVGLYLETLGAVLLLIVSGGGLLAGVGADAPGRQVGAGAGPTSAS